MPDMNFAWGRGASPVLLQIDPTQAIIAPWMQYGVIGSAVIALGVVAVMQWRHIVDLTAAQLADAKECGNKYADLLAKQIGSLNDMAHVIERLGDKIK